MKRVYIATNQVGFVIRNNMVQRVLTVGKYWLGFGEKLELHDMGKQFQSVYDIDVLLQTAGFADTVHVVEVPDAHICLVFVNANFVKVLAAGRYIFWKSLSNYRFMMQDISTIAISPAVERNLLERAELAGFVRQYKLEPAERGLLFVDGVFKEVLEAGIYTWWKNAINIAVSKIDIRVLSIDINGQEMLTKDKAQVRVNFFVRYQVVDIMRALLENKEHERQLYTLMQLLLRSYIGQWTLDEIMEKKDDINRFIGAEAAVQAARLGLEIHFCGMKDLILPGDVRDIMNQVLVAEKRAQANIITRREETASTRSLLNTAKLMEDNSMLFKLKEMEYVEKISEKISTISLSGNGQVIDQLKQLFSKS